MNYGPQALTHQNFLQNVHQTLGQLSGSASKCLEDVLDHHMSWGVALPALKNAGLLRSDYQRPTVDEGVKALREMALRDHPPREESESKESGSKRKGAHSHSVHCDSSMFSRNFLLVKIQFFLFRLQAAKEEVCLRDRGETFWL